MNTISRRIAATALLAAPALIALGTATSGNAATSITNNGFTIRSPSGRQVAITP